MKIKQLISLLAVLVTFGAYAQTNTTMPALTTTNEVAEYDKVDLTLGSAGTAINGTPTFGLDVSVSVDPFKKLPDLWVGMSQSLYWQPMFAGSTDFDADWNMHVYKDLYSNVGWSAGSVYAADASTFYRTGPEAQLQYYISDSAYIYGNANFDLPSRGQCGLRYGFGIGIEF